jgi:hypothetical protein
MERPEGGEPLFDASQHQVANHLAAGAAGGGLPGDDLPVMGVDGKGQAHHLAVPARDLQAIGGPAEVRFWGNDAALVDADGFLGAVPLEQQVSLRHQAVDLLVV